MFVTKKLLKVEKKMDGKIKTALHEMIRQLFHRKNIAEQHNGTEPPERYRFRIIRLFFPDRLHGVDGGRFFHLHVNHQSRKDDDQ